MTYQDFEQILEEESEEAAEEAVYDFLLSRQGSFSQLVDTQYLQHITNDEWEKIGILLVSRYDRSAYTGKGILPHRLAYGSVKDNIAWVKNLLLAAIQLDLEQLLEEPELVRDKLYDCCFYDPAWEYNEEQLRSVQGVLSEHVRYAYLPDLKEEYWLHLRDLCNHELDNERKKWQGIYYDSSDRGWLLAEKQVAELLLTLIQLRIEDLLGIFNVPDLHEIANFITTTDERLLDCVRVLYKARDRG